MAEPDRRGDEQRPPRPRIARAPRCAAARRGVEARGELVDQPVDEHRVARHRDVARSRRACTCSAPVSSANARPRSNGWQLSRSPWTTSTGQRTRRQIASTSSVRRATRLGVIHQHRLDAAVEPVGDGVLDLLRRVRLGEHLAEEELEEAALVGEDVVAVLLLPARRALALLVPNVACAAARHGCGGVRSGTPGASATMPEHALRVRRGDLDRGPDAVAADAGEHGRLGRGGVHHRQAVGRVPAVAPRPGGSGLSELPFPRPS